MWFRDSSLTANAVLDRYDDDAVADELVEGFIYGLVASLSVLINLLDSNKIVFGGQTMIDNCCLIKTVSELLELKCGRSVC